MANEIRELRTQWQTRRQILMRAGFNQADEELARTLYLADSSALIGSILGRLRATPLYQEFDANDWIRHRGPAGVIGAGRTNLGFSLDEQEMAAQCLKVLEWAVERFHTGKSGLQDIGQTTHTGRSTKIVDYVRGAIETVFDPFYHYVDKELRNQETLVTPTDIMRDVQSLVDSEVSIRCPKTHELLLKAYHQLFTSAAARSGASWNQLGYGCRHILIRFADEVFDPDYVPNGQEQPKGDDAREKLKWTVRHNLKVAKASGQYRESIERIVDANWKFINSVGHREESATEEDARLAVIYTYLTLWLVDRVLSHAG
jgi:hypothetical protein